MKPLIGGVYIHCSIILYICHNIYNTVSTCVPPEDPASCELSDEATLITAEGLYVQDVPLISIWRLNTIYLQL